MGAIDFRFRPVGTQSISRDLTYEYLRKMRLAAAPSFEAQDIDLMFREMDEAGIDTVWLAEAYPWWRKHQMEARGSTVVSALMAQATKRLTIG